MVIETVGTELGILLSVLGMPCGPAEAGVAAAATHAVPLMPIASTARAVFLDHAFHGGPGHGASSLNGTVKRIVP